MFPPVWGERLLLLLLDWGVREWSPQTRSWHDPWPSSPWSDAPQIDWDVVQVAPKEVPAGTVPETMGGLALALRVVVGLRPREWPGPTRRWVPPWVGQSPVSAVASLVRPRWACPCLPLVREAAVVAAAVAALEQATTEG